MLGMIRKTFSYFDVQMLRILYTTYVRPHLEFAISAWCPYLKHDIEKLVQRRATRIVYSRGGTLPLPEK